MNTHNVCLQKKKSVCKNETRVFPNLDIHLEYVFPIVIFKSLVPSPFKVWPALSQTTMEFDPDFKAVDNYTPSRPTTFNACISVGWIEGPVGPECGVCAETAALKYCAWFAA